jgi:EmrB/QacA subfamily drug resistance transporter
MVFLDGTVVNVALPAIQEDLGTSLGGLQWTVNAYLVTLTALLLLGGNLGDRFGRRRTLVVGLVGFTVASVLCGVAPTPGALIAARALQGVGGALLVPGSLAIISASFHPNDRGRAVGAWSGLAGVVSSIGPFLGGWLIDAISWRAVFLINLPLAALAIWIALRHVPESDAGTEHPIDLPGAALVTVALGALCFAAIETGGAMTPLALVVGGSALIGFIAVERLVAHPMLPLSVFRSTQFSATNLATLAVYAGLGGAFFLVLLRLQLSLGYSALEAGSALVPFTILMLLLSPAAGQLGQRLGARIPLTVGPLVAATGILGMSGIEPGDRYLSAVLPGVAVFGLGMAVTVAPLTAAVLGSVEDDLAGTASGVNNAVARLAGLLAVATLPTLTGIAGATSLDHALDHGYTSALQVAAAVTATGGLIALALVRRTATVTPTVQPSILHSCNDPALARQHPVSAPQG